MQAIFNFGKSCWVTFKKNLKQHENEPNTVEMKSSRKSEDLTWKTFNYIYTMRRILKVEKYFSSKVICSCWNWATQNYKFQLWGRNFFCPHHRGRGYFWGLQSLMMLGVQCFFPKKRRMINTTILFVFFHFFLRKHHKLHQLLMK